MPVINSPIKGCAYVSDDADPVVADALLTLLMVHDNFHTTAATPPTRQKTPKIVRPVISGRSPEETWNTFSTRWQLFKQGNTLAPAEDTGQFFGCKTTLHYFSGS